MTSRQKYRHISTLDTDLYVHKVPFHNDKYLVVRASIVDRKTEHVYEIATFKIYKEHIRNWKVVGE